MKLLLTAIQHRLGGGLFLSALQQLLEGGGTIVRVWCSKCDSAVAKRREGGLFVARSLLSCQVETRKDKVV